MKLYFLLLYALLIINAPSIAMVLPTCQMPNEAELQKRLIAHRIFLEKTQILPQIAQKELTAFQVVTIIEGAISKFIHAYEPEANSVGHITKKDIAQMHMVGVLEGQKSTVLGKILRDYPAQLKIAQKEMIRRTRELARARKVSAKL